MCKCEKYSGKKLTIDVVFVISIVTTFFVLSTFVYIAYTLIDQTIPIPAQLRDERFILIAVAGIFSIVTIACICYIYRRQVILYQIISQNLITKSSVIFGISNGDSERIMD